MRERRARLARLVELFRIVKRANEARIGQLSHVAAALEERENQILAALERPALMSAPLQQAANRRLQAIARERTEIRVQIEAEKAQRLTADRRARAAARALDRLDAQLRDQTARRDVEELRLGPSAAPAPGKCRDDNIGPRGAISDEDFERHHF